MVRLAAEEWRWLEWELIERLNLLRMRNDTFSGADWRTSVADEILIVLKLIILLSGDSPLLVPEVYRSLELAVFSWLTKRACRGLLRVAETDVES